MAWDAKLSQLLVKHSQPTDELRRVNLQNVAELTVLAALKTVAGSKKRRSKRAQVARQCKELSATPFFAAFSTLLTGREDYKNFCEALRIEN